MSSSSSSKFYEYAASCFDVLFCKGSWINVGFTWSPTKGILLFVNGTFTGFVSPPPLTTQVPRRANQFCHITVGRFANDISKYWEVQSSEAGIGYLKGSFAVSDIFYVEQELPADQFENTIGMPGTSSALIL